MVCAVLIWIWDCLPRAVREVITREVIVKTEQGQVRQTRITIPPFGFKTEKIF